jgi:preprotein translocase subunit SecG
MILKQSGSATRTTLITLAAIVAFLVVAFMLLPKGFKSDISVIGQGSNVVVLAHNKAKPDTDGFTE